ncbi:MAG: hypothetical protein R3253_17290 [Longimicrobiales bacterium]|nr:hypothetical protein [Longimicrobiales bacterium]
MKRIIGMGVGVAYLGLVFVALQKASAGWATGYEDLGFWWTVIAVILSIAAGGAIIGTWLHTRESES